MKKYLLFLIMCILACQLLHAENYPYRSDYLWVTVPDHDDWNYRCGENATIDVEFLKYGMPCDGKVTYTVANDMLEDDDKGSIELKHGKGKINIGTRKTPGFRDLRLKIKVGNKEYSHHIKVGFSVDEIVPYTKEPSDFMDFWQNNISEMEKKPLHYSKELAKEYCTDNIDCYLIKLDTYDGYAMYGYLFYPKDAKPESCPAVLCPPGAGIKTIKEPLKHKYYAENGFIRLEIEIHGLNPRLSDAKFQEISNAFNGRSTGYLADGIDSRDRYYMKHIYLGLIRCIDLLTRLPEWDGKNVAVQGGSQGGALSMVAAGLDKRVTQCVVNHPALADMAAYAEKGRTGGYPHFNRIPSLLTKQNIETLAYFDVVNFARHLTCPTLMTWGYNDNTVPPTTSWAVWNTLTSPKESLITPINEHWTSDETEYNHMVWIKGKLK